MSTQELTLEQVCKEQADSRTAFEIGAPDEGPVEDMHVLAPSPSPNLSDVSLHLVKVLSQPLSLDDMLYSLANVAMRALHIDLCVILLTDATRGQLLLETCAPDLRDQRVVIESVEVDAALWERLRGAMALGQLPRLTHQEYSSLNPLKNVQYETLLPLPLIVGNEYVGLMNCYSSKTQDWSREEQLMLITIASQAALAIRHLQHLEADAQTQKNLARSLFDDLFSGNVGVEESLYRRATFLGCDLALPHVVVLMEISSVGAREHAPSETERVALYRRVMGQLGQRVLAQYPGSLVGERDRALVSLLRASDNVPLQQITEWLDELVRQVRDEQQVYLSIGVGNICYAMPDYRRGYAEANEALEIGLFLNQEGGTMQFNALGVYRYIYKFARTDTLHDEYQRQIHSIADYDQRKSTHLLETLEAYLECGGNAAKVYSQLNIHRNTMLQRMERLQALCSIDLEEHEHRLPLLVALKVYKLRAHSA
ncbi:MAG TPA: helix-turn-helix domain-containing protein [Ktedonobacteraceae bacterium]|nr:helix-turn-helix domain-containing protein [Ktedonobacteraceae bacterium]